MKHEYDTSGELYDSSLLPRDGKGVRWKVIPEEQRLIIIEGETQKIYETTGRVNRYAFGQTHRQDLLGAITRYYPGGLIPLKHKMGLKTPTPGIGIEEMGIYSENIVDTSGRVIWSKLHQDQRIQLIESEVTRFVRSGEIFTSSNLKRLCKYGLLGAIKKYYPNGFKGVQDKFELKPKRAPNHYWNEETVEKEARDFFEEYGILSKRSLALHGRYDLNTAISHKFPGGMRGLKLRMSLTVNKPQGFWTPAIIEREAQVFISQHGSISAKLLITNGRSDLLNAIRVRYKDEMTGLKRTLNAKRTRKDNYWTSEKIEEEALKFFIENGTLTAHALVSNGRSDLATQINKHYIGGYREIKSKLEIKEDKVPDGYWTPETIETRAIEFLSTYGTLKTTVLRSRMSSLGFAISHKYPGGPRALEEKLGIKNTSDHIDANQANEQLKRLLD